MPTATAAAMIPNRAIAPPMMAIGTPISIPSRVIMPPMKVMIRPSKAMLLGLVRDRRAGAGSLTREAWPCLCLCVMATDGGVPSLR